jgi:hypothetical protein
MKFGIVLVSYIAGEHRVSYANQSFASLSKTNFEGLERPVMQISIRPTDFDYSPFIQQWSQHMDVDVKNDEYFVGSCTDALFVCCANKLLADHEDITHVTFLTNDFIYNPHWLRQLQGLIERHPGARAWTVYKSANDRHHRTIRIDENGDHLVTSISSMGAISRQEWLEYNPDANLGNHGYIVPDSEGGGATLDLHHCWARKGEYWGTGVDYQQHIGKWGINCCPGTPEYALNFVGE